MTPNSNKSNRLNALTDEMKKEIDKIIDNKLKQLGINRNETDRSKAGSISFT